MIIMGVTALAKKIGVSRVTVYQYMDKGMPYHRISEKKIAFDYDEVLAWVKRGFVLDLQEQVQ